MIAAGSLAVISVLVGSPASADYFGSRYADGGSHSMWYPSSNLGSARYDGVHYARTVSIDGGTDVGTSQVSQYSVSTDVAVVMTSNPPPDLAGAFAWAQCTRPASSSICDQSTVTFNANKPHSDYRALACHELGHTLGLKDGQFATYGSNSASAAVDRSCMRSNPDVRYYSNHDKGHINGQY